MKVNTKKVAPASTLVIKASAQEMAATPAQIVSSHAATVATVQAATGMAPWLKLSVGEPDLTALIDKIGEQTEAMQRGDMSQVESMLFAQALTLQAAFTTLSRRAAMNTGEFMGATDTYLRLALKAQGQCRATLETLANIKNPRPIAFVKQANIANGPQQVNNGTPEPNDPRVRAREKNESAQNELLTDSRATHENPMDSRATSAASAGNPNVATMETGHRATNG
jgi:hypothetical protein